MTSDTLDNGWQKLDRRFGNGLAALIAKQCWSCTSDGPIGTQDPSGFVMVFVPAGQWLVLCWVWKFGPDHSERCTLCAISWSRWQGAAFIYTYIYIYIILHMYIYIYFLFNGNSFHFFNNLFTYVSISGCSSWFSMLRNLVSLDRHWDSQPAVGGGFGRQAVSSCGSRGQPSHRNIRDSDISRWKLYSIYIMYNIYICTIYNMM